MKVYSSDQSTDRSQSDRIKVGVADYAVGHAGSTLVTSGLGSCVGIALADVEAPIAGLAHAMLPHAEADDANEHEPVHNEAKYVDTAVPALLRSMVDAGADRSRIDARVAGGSAMFEFESVGGGVGERNVAAAKAVLDELDIDIVGTDVGGDCGRSLTFEVATGELTVRRAHGDTHVI